MAEDKESKGGEEFDKDLLDEALKEFDASGGFTGKSKGVTTPPKPATPPKPEQPSKKMAIEDEFPHFDDEDEEEFALPPPKKAQTENKKPEGQVSANSNDNSNSAPVAGKNSGKVVKKIEEDFDDFDDQDGSFLEDDFLEDKPANDSVKKGGGGSGGGSGSGGGGEDDGNDGDRRAMIIKKMKEPKNMVIIGVAFLFLLFLVFSGGSKKRKPQAPSIENVEVQQAVDVDINNSKKEEKLEKLPENATASQIPNISLADIQLPNLDIKVPEVKQTNVDLIPKIPEIKKPEVPKIEDIKVPDIININNSKPKVPDAASVTQKEDELEDIDIKDEMVKKKRDIIKNKDELKPIVTDFTGGTKITKDKKKQNAKDFIFVDADLDTEAEDNVIKATKIQDPENVIAQGRIIDAVLETAINSTIGGQIRAIVTRDVYAETGRNILIPKGTRLYGEYGGAKGQQSNDRIVITWTRIMRPDNVTANINSFAADQFGRSGIQGNVDKKYFGNITTSVLLSTIPLVTTIVVNAITSARQNTVTTTGIGGATVVQDPINIATQSFAQQVSNTTSEIIKNTQDLKPTITLEQGTRVKVLVNQDIKLPVYKSITKTSSGVTS